MRDANLRWSTGDVDLYFWAIIKGRLGITGLEDKTTSMSVKYSEGPEKSLCVSVLGHCPSRRPGEEESLCEKSEQQNQGGKAFESK